MGFSGVVAPLFFIRPWRTAYYRKLDHICGRLYVFWATVATLLYGNHVECNAFPLVSFLKNVAIMPYVDMNEDCG
ncbi:hypothetical protein Gohar_014158, partial [Gossypium harknessii]|nr:hypothetical protein [Gossypium harknessii]